ncbi:putative polyol transporter 2 [Humulus lupulus]|uniref:putative polyol transporter 2 n=1 Tax=Humulus lupulus TaxID=3486 RepID=UPI002B41625C|nr:putative polyol transporter 2 [Humulus lupulus]
MDRQGRKSLLITSFGGMAASMMLLSLSFTWKVLAPYSSPLAVLGTVLYVLSFSLGASSVPALLLPEIFASRIRAKAVALSLGMHWFRAETMALCIGSTAFLPTSQMNTLEEYLEGDDEQADVDSIDEQTNGASMDVDHEEEDNNKENAEDKKKTHKRTRGIVRMTKIIADKIKGIKRHLRFNSRGNQSGPQTESFNVI